MARPLLNLKLPSTPTSSYGSWLWSSSKRISYWVQERYWSHTSTNQDYNLSTNECKASEISYWKNWMDETVRTRNKIIESFLLLVATLLNVCYWRLSTICAEDFKPFTSERHESLRSWPQWYHCSAWIYSSPSVPSICLNSPTQLFPWSLKPGRHVQLNPPRRFRHVVVFDGQLWVPSLHSSMSDMRAEKSNDSHFGEKIRGCDHQNQNMLCCFSPSWQIFSAKASGVDELYQCARPLPENKASDGLYKATDTKTY